MYNNKRIISALVALGLLAVGSVPVFADDTTNAGMSNTNGTTTNTDEKEMHDKKTDKEVKMKEVDLVCMQTAVVKRDNAIIAALDTYYANVKAALVARRDALKAAWGLPDRKERQEAIRKAWEAFRGTWKKERRALNDARKAAWKQFDKDKRDCNGQGEGEDQGNDANL